MRFLLISAAFLVAASAVADTQYYSVLLAGKKAG